MKEHLSERRIFSIFFLYIVVLMGADVVADLTSGAEITHIVMELSIVAVSAIALTALVIRKILRLNTQLFESVRDLDLVSRESEHWREKSQDLLSGLGHAIDLQFDRWHLSPTEKDVALLILKGLSLREVSQVREVSEKTVRQQSLAIYRKSGLGGRAELSAFFLEDLLLPLRENGNQEGIAGNGN